MIAKHKINMDLTIRTAPPTVYMVKNDANSRAVELVMTADGAAWQPENLTNVFLRYRRPDGSGGCYDTLPDGTKAWELEENRLRILITDQMLSVSGFTEAQAVLLREESQLTTFRFQLYTDEDLSDGIVEEEDYINWVAWAQGELDARLLEAKNSGDFDGATYFPTVDDQGLLTWSNDRGAENPEAVDLVGMLADRLGENMFLHCSGGTMSGELDMGSCRITALASPEEGSDAVTKDYADRIFRKATVTLPAILWSSGRISAQVTGVTAENLVLICPEESTRDTWLSCGIRCTGQETDKLVFSCDVTPQGTVKANVVVFLRGDAE